MTSFFLILFTVLAYLYAKFKEIHVRGKVENYTMSEINMSNNTQLQPLSFVPVELSDMQRIYVYTSKFGEGSCQHSPISMWSLSEKYGDEACIEDDILYVCRKNLCNELYRVYLAPLGANATKGFERILEDAKYYGKKAKFVTLTKGYADTLANIYPDEFKIEEDRNLAEYMYRTERMASFSGRSLKKRRSEVNTFWNMYGEHATVKLIQIEDHEDILEFEKKWLKQNAHTHDENSLYREARMIKKQLEHFDDFGLSGIVLRIDGQVYGFGYGVKLSDTFYDAIIEKGDREIPHIYKVLRQESVKQCAADCVYVNMEEDVGIEGLRALKLAYKPEYILSKYIAVQKN